MVQPGGKSAMLGHWRIVLRQAEEAARAGRYDEALALASRADVADHHHMVQLRGRMALDLIARAGRRGEADDLAGAIDDLRLAEQLGAPPDAMAAARLRLADRVAGEMSVDLDAGQPDRACERIDELARHRISGPALRRIRETADAWRNALEEARRGEFGRAFDCLDHADRLSAGIAQPALAAARRDVETRQKAAGPKVEALYSALQAGQWPAILNAAEAVLETVPEHPAARQARSRAWQQIAALSPSAGLPGRGGRIPQAAPPPSAVEPDPSRTAEATPILWANGAPRTGMNASPRPLARGTEIGPSGRFLLWVDAVGGYLVCLDDQVVLGRAGHESAADVPLMGDLARNHAVLSRSGDGYVIRANQPTFVNGQPVETAPLHDGDVIRLGPTLELEFRQPSPASSTSRLAIVSRHRLPLAVDGILLMAETCIIGGSAQAHIPAPGLAQPVVLYRQGTSLWCRAPESFEVDGRPCSARAPLTLQSSVLGQGFSFSLEALGGKTV